MEVIREETKIGDSVGDMSILFGVGCIFSPNCSVFLPISVSHLVLCSFIDNPLEWFDPWTNFYHLILCIRGLENIRSSIYVGCALPNHVHTLLFFEQSCTSPFLVGILM